MAQIKTGTVALTSGSPRVTASAGVNWGAAFPGAVWTRAGSGVIYFVAAVRAPTSAGNSGATWALDLSAPYQGASETAAAYALHLDFLPGGTPLLRYGDTEVLTLMNAIAAKADGQALGGQISTGQTVPNQTTGGTDHIVTVGTGAPGDPKRLHII